MYKSQETLLATITQIQSTRHPPITIIFLKGSYYYLQFTNGKTHDEVPRSCSWWGHGARIQTQAQRREWRRMGTQLSYSAALPKHWQTHQKPPKDILSVSRNEDLGFLQSLMSLLCSGISLWGGTRSPTWWLGWRGAILQLPCGGWASRLATTISGRHEHPGSSGESRGSVDRQRKSVINYGRWKYKVMNPVWGLSELESLALWMHAETATAPSETSSKLEWLPVLRLAGCRWEDA